MEQQILWIDFHMPELAAAGHLQWEFRDDKLQTDGSDAISSLSFILSISLPFSLSFFFCMYFSRCRLIY